MLMYFFISCNIHDDAVQFEFGLTRQWCRSKNWIENINHTICAKSKGQIWADYASDLYISHTFSQVQ